MCQDLNQKVSTIVNDWVSKGYMFSAFDVTKSLRNMGESVAHWEVRDEVRNQYGTGNLGGYLRTLVSVSPTGTNMNETFIYHSCTSDPDMYNHDWQNTDPTQDKCNGKSQSVNVNQCAKSTNGVTVTHNGSRVGLTKSERRLNIPVSLLQTIDVEPGDGVVLLKQVNNGDTKAILSKTSKIKNTTWESMYVTGNDNRIRISENTLKDIFGNSAKSEFWVHVSDSSDSIVVEPA